MEEDIKILEESIIQGKYHLYKKDLKKCVSNVIKAYKELEEERQIVGMPVRNKRDGRIGIVLHQWKSGSVAVLESINPRVINTHDSWNTLEIVTDEVEQTQTKCETIPVSLVEEKIEELNKQEQKLQDSISDEEREEYSDANISFELMDIEIRRNVLQELLEKRK